MAVPKKRTGKSAQAKRRANWKATVPATTTCKNCGSIVLTHTVCSECGTYKNKPVSIKNVMTAAGEKEVKETKKASKKVKETETKAEETKAEAENTDAASEEKPKRTRKTKKADAAESEEQ